MHLLFLIGIFSLNGCVLLSVYILRFGFYMEERQVNFSGQFILARGLYLFQYRLCFSFGVNPQLNECGLRRL
jgi:hypothetical protein